MLSLFKNKLYSKHKIKEHHTFSNQNHHFDYTLIKKPNMKNCYIRIKDAQVIVSVNTKVSMRYIENFLNSKSAWIAAKLKIASLSTDADLTNPDSKLWLLGEGLSIKITIDQAIKKERLTTEDNYAHFMLKSTPTNTKLKALRDIFYKECSREHITPIVEQYSTTMQLYPTNITYRKTKSRWGSCSAKNSISLNTRLMMLPSEILEYIIIHELAHIKHKNHSHNFWDLVAQYDPDYKKHRKELRKYERLF